MTYEQAKLLLEQNAQGHLLKFWPALSPNQQAALLAQIAALDFASISRMQTLLDTLSTVATEEPVADPVPPEVLELDAAQRAEAAVAGEAALQAGQVGILLVAGGQGSRLGFDGPKGAYPVGPVSNAPLFFFHARKIRALSQRYSAPIPFYIMTSEMNDADTRACFAANGFFGLPKEDVFFFKQGMWPALTPQGKIILDTPSHIFMSPDGHGGTLSALDASGALADMRKRGLTTLFYFQVDNPLVDIADPAFIGVHLQAGAEFSLKLCKKRDPDEGLGVVVKRGRRFEMVEYTELTPEQKNRRTEDGELYFKYGSVAIHLFSLAFLVEQAKTPMPLHRAHKKIPFCDDAGATVTPDKNNGFKFEKFIFDLLPHAKQVVNLAFDRRDEFSPVKNAKGEDSPETCKRDMSAKTARMLIAAGFEIPLDADGYPSQPIEIDPCFALTPRDLKARLAAAPDPAQPIYLPADR